MQKLVNSVADIVVEYYSNYPHLMREDILHTQEVVCYTRQIAIGEGLSADDVAMVEIAAWLHDIGCPRSKEIYGNSLPVNQQSVGRTVSHEILATIEDLSPLQREWIEDVVASHHQFKESVRLGFAPLFEADLIANLLSGYYKADHAQNLYDSMMRTESGKRIFKTLKLK